MVEERPIMSVKYCLPVLFQSSTFGENYNAPYSAVSAIAEHLVGNVGAQNLRRAQIVFRLMDLSILT